MKVIIKSILFLSITACGSPQPTVRTPAPAKSCNTSLNIVNGTESTGYSAVGLITVGGSSICTGTFISHNAMITAAHCVPANSDGSVSGGGDIVYIEKNSLDLEDIPIASANGIEAIQAYAYKKVTSSNIDLGDIDLAIVIFPDNTAPSILKIASSKPVGEKTVTLVGFGDVNINDADTVSSLTTATKRTGSVQLVDHDSDGLYAEGPSSSSSGDNSDIDGSLAAQGDSGGPVIYNGEIVGVVSAGVLGPIDPNAERVDQDGKKIPAEEINLEGYAYNYYVDLNRSESKSFLAKIAAEESITFNSSTSEANGSEEENGNGTGSSAVCLK